MQLLGQRLSELWFAKPVRTNCCTVAFGCIIIIMFLLLLMMMMIMMMVNLKYVSVPPREWQQAGARQ